MTMKCLKLVLFMGIVGLGSCNRADRPDPTAGTVEGTEGASTGQQVQTKVLRLYSWSEYFDPEMLEKFEEQTGIEIEYVTFGSTDEARARIQSEPGFYDLVVLDNGAAQELFELKLAEVIDEEKVPNLQNLDARYLGISSVEDSRFGVPYTWGTTLVAYRADQVSDPQPSWELLWDQNLNGKVMMMDEREEVFQITKMVLGESAKPAEVASMLTRQIKDVGVRYGDDADVRQGLLDGSVLAGMCYSGDAAMIAEEDEGIDFFLPEEGAPIWVDSFVVTRDTQHSDEAHAFINFMLEPEVAAASSNYTWYATPNAAAEEFLDEELRGDERIYPDSDVLDKLTYLKPLSADRDTLLNQVWFTVQTTLRNNQPSEVEQPGNAATSEE